MGQVGSATGSVAFRGVRSNDHAVLVASVRPEGLVKIRELAERRHGNWVAVPIDKLELGLVHIEGPSEPQFGGRLMNGFKGKS